jgi:hypothetical protein
MALQESSGLLSTLSGSDAIKLLELIHNSLACNSHADFTELFPLLQGLFAFDFVGTLLGRHDDGNRLVIAHGVNISFPDVWLSE